VRLVATGRTVPEQSDGRSFQEGAVDEVLLWKEVAVVVGQTVNRHCGFYSLNAQVMMLAAHGEYS
jgi:hypothetical protein